MGGGGRLAFSAWLRARVGGLAASSWRRHALVSAYPRPVVPPYHAPPPPPPPTPAARAPLALQLQGRLLGGAGGRQLYRLPRHFWPRGGARVAAHRLGAGRLRAAALAEETACAFHAALQTSHRPPSPCLPEPPFGLRFCCACQLVGCASRGADDLPRMLALLMLSLPICLHPNVSTHHRQPLPLPLCAALLLLPGLLGPAVTLQLSDLSSVPVGSLLPAQRAEGRAWTRVVPSLHQAAHPLQDSLHQIGGSDVRWQQRYASRAAEKPKRLGEGRYEMGEAGQREAICADVE